MTPLIQAAVHGNMQLINLILSSPSMGSASFKSHYVNQQENKGFTALLRAALANHIDVVRSLVRTHGADINHQDSHGTKFNHLMKKRFLRFLKLQKTFFHQMNLHVCYAVIYAKYIMFFDIIFFCEE